MHAWVCVCVCVFPEACTLCLASAECDHAPFCLQPLKVVDPDHPLAMLVRKAQADSPAPAPPSAEGAAGQPSQVEYASDCEYLAGRCPL